MATDTQLSDGFKALIDKVVLLAKNANNRRHSLQDALSNGEIDVNGSTFTGNGRVIRDYENALEELKAVTQNKSPDHLHNHHLQLKIEGATHAVRGLEVQLVHDGSPEHKITAVILRGFISVCPADGNEAPSYSSKSSSSSVP